MWNFELVKEMNVIDTTTCPESVFVKLHLLWIVVACTFSSMQLKWNWIWDAQRGGGCVRGVVALRMRLNTSSCRGPAHPSVAVSPFCFGPASCISAFLDERFLPPVLVFQALAKFCKPALAKCSWFPWAVFKNRRAALPIIRILMHCSSSLLQAPNLRWAGSRQ